MVKTKSEIINHVQAASKILPLVRLGLCLQSCCFVEQVHKLSDNAPCRTIKRRNEAVKELDG